MPRMRAGALTEASPPVAPRVPAPPSEEELVSGRNERLRVLRRSEGADGGHPGGARGGDRGEALEGDSTEGEHRHAERRRFSEHLEPERRLRRGLARRREHRAEHHVVGAGVARGRDFVETMRRQAEEKIGEGPSERRQRQPGRWQMNARGAARDRDVEATVDQDRDSGRHARHHTLRDLEQIVALRGPSRGSGSPRPRLRQPIAPTPRGRLRPRCAVD